jgi:curved DNA-binding protein CbpA
MAIDFKKDYYKTLEVSKDATEAEIKKAYRRLSFKYHPDQNGGRDLELFSPLFDAYKVLSTPALRAQYDAGRFGTARVRTAPKPANDPRPNPGTTKVVKMAEYLYVLKKLYEQTFSNRRRIALQLVEKPFELLLSFVLKVKYDRDGDFSSKIHAMNADGSTGVWEGRKDEVFMSAETMQYCWHLQDKNILMRVFNPEAASLRKKAFNDCFDYRRDINEKPKHMYSEMGL